MTPTTSAVIRTELVLRLRRSPATGTRAARRDAAAFALVYDDHHQALYRYCRSIVGHDQDAQDALQSTMELAFAALRHERRDLELRPWLFRIAHNEAISILRRRRETTGLDESAGTCRDIEDLIAKREDLRELRYDLADLTERQRTALVQRELSGLGHEDIAQQLGCSPGAVKQAIFEARRALLKCREGREMACHDVQRTLSDGDGRHLRGRRLRSHLRTCPGCRRFQTDLTERPRILQMLSPPLSPGATAALLRQLLSHPTTATHTWSPLAAGGVAQALTTKVMISVSVVAMMAGGAGVAVHDRQALPPPSLAAFVGLDVGARGAAAVGQDPGVALDAWMTAEPRSPVRTTAGRAKAPTGPTAAEPSSRTAEPPYADDGGLRPAERGDGSSTHAAAPGKTTEASTRSAAQPTSRAADGARTKPTPPARGIGSAGDRPSGRAGDGGRSDTARGHARPNRARRDGPSGAAQDPRAPAAAGGPSRATEESSRAPTTAGGPPGAAEQPRAAAGAGGPPDAPQGPRSRDGRR